MSQSLTSELHLQPTAYIAIPRNICLLAVGETITWPEEDKVFTGECHRPIAGEHKSGQVVPFLLVEKLSSLSNACRHAPLPYAPPRMKIMKPDDRSKARL